MVAITGRQRDRTPDKAAGIEPVSPSTPVVDAPFWRSIRFRLTGWYALLVFCLILGLAIALHTLLARTLADDAEQRLRAAALEIAETSDVRPVDLQGPLIPSGGNIAIEIEPPDEASFLLSGLWFQVYDAARQPYVVSTGRSVNEIPAALETALVNPDEYWTDRTVLRSISVGGVESMVLITPLTLRINGEVVEQDSPPGWIVVGEPLGSREKLIDIADQSLFLFGTAGGLLAIWIGWLMAGRALTPVTKVTESASAIAQTDGGVSLSRRVVVPNTGDELTHLAMTFNTMLDRIERAFDTQKRFVADASHELRTPLTAVRGNVDVLVRQLNAGRELNSGEMIEDLQVVQRESGRMGRLIDDMLMLARTDGSSLGDILKPEQLELNLVASEAYRTAGQLANGHEITLEAEETIRITGDRDRLAQVMIILLDNAIRHTPADGTVTLAIDRESDPESGTACARIRVSDTGEGIPAEHLPHLFERFYRVEVARSRMSGGTGLGLSIALAIVRGHRGWIDVDTMPGEGTAFTVWLPFENGFEANGGDLAKSGRSAVKRSPRLRAAGLVRRVPVPRRNPPTEE
jgi:signal transduction histidine kinase